MAIISRQEIADLMEQAIWSKMKTKYGKNVSPQILSRVQEEWNAVLAVDGVLNLAAVCELTKQLREEGHPYSVRGTPASSFLLYLLGVTLTNPLKPHLFCPKCHRLVWKPEFSDAWDIPEEVCAACGTPMVADGHDVPWQTHWGFGDHIPRYEIMVDYRLREQIMAWADNHWLRKLVPDLWPGYLRSTSDNIVMLKFGGIDCGFMADYSDVSETFWSNVSVPTKALLHDEEKEKILELGFPKPENFADLVHIKGLIHGTGVWDPQVKELVTRNIIPIAFLPAFRDDIFEWMVYKGTIPKDAWYAAEYVRRGYGLPFTPEGPHKLRDRWMMKWCRRIVYLLPKGHIIEYMLFEMKAGKV